MRMATTAYLEPDDDALFCPHCGNNIDDDIEGEVEDNGVTPYYLARNVSLVLMRCGAIVQDGQFLNKSQAREEFSD